MSKEDPRVAGMTEVNQASKKNAALVFRIGVAAIAVVVLGLLVWYLFFGVNHSPESAAKAAFRASYVSCDLKTFQKATVFNDDCQLALNFDASEDLAVMKPAFEEMKAWMKETGETYHITDAKTKKYDALCDEYQEAVTLFQNVYDSARVSDITEVALVTLTVESHFPDENGNQKEETFEDTCWCFKVGKKWYAFPMLTE